MARSQKEGLEYFPLDVDIDMDDKIYFLEAKYGPISFALLIKLFMKIYKNGYFYTFTEKEAIIFSKQAATDLNIVKSIVNDSVNEGLFHSSLYSRYKILTSRGIQKRYFEACLRRKAVSACKEYLLIDPEKYQNLVYVDINEENVDINSINDNIGTQSKVKESKVNKSKVNNTHVATCVAESVEAEAGKPSGSNNAVEGGGAHPDQDGRGWYAQEFEKFWCDYPRKVEKTKAIRAWKARIKEGESPAHILQAGTHYANYCRLRQLEQRYIKHCSTFIGPDKPYAEFIRGSPEIVTQEGDPKSWDALRALYSEYDEEERGSST